MMDEIVSARAAQREYARWSQERVDDLVAAVGWHCYREDNARRLAEVSYLETHFGNTEDLFRLYRQRVLGILMDMRGHRTGGVVEENHELGLARLAKPVGVVAVAGPATAPASAIVCNILPVLKTRNAVIFTSNPRAREASEQTVALVRQVLADQGAPVDLVAHLGISGKDETRRLMTAADLVVAVGGAGTVRRAYTSGTPAIGAGVGNPTVIVDETADPAVAARHIADGAAFNHGTSCSSESNVLVHESVRGAFLEQLSRYGAHVCDRAASARLERVLWPDGSTRNRALVGLTARRTAAAAGFDAGAAHLLVAGCDDPTGDSPLLLEKLAPVVTVCGYRDFGAAVAAVNTILDRCGGGHSCGIYSSSAERIATLAHATRTARVVVNQSTMTNAGSFTSGVPFTTTLSSGTWGGCSLSENVTWRHLLNYTTVTRPIGARVPDEAAIFGRHLDTVAGFEQLSAP
ncbi:aldehyde dehydrogenase family protein [Nocardia stercoris]|uniref:Aldehyde dehydrogenase family protein n=1 Tax=Nocardia stercoris TaxID=2483361 RepID=A0A3M2KY24_9NOCA|nr:aldehyde dehydrogenase family protein [Nocardia stercoris]RMI30417.1 aldehyde dehydrogenase family protein [Nocardia stercoris]